MKRKALVSALSLALLSLSQVATAGIVTLNSSIANATHLSAGSVNGIFDGTSLLPENYQINSASFSFSFADDSDSFTQGNPYYLGTTYGAYNYSGGGYNGNYYNYYNRNVTTQQSVQKTGQAESVNVSLAGIASGAGETSLTQSSSSSTVYQGQTYDGASGYNGYSYSCGNHCGGWSPGNWNYYYSNNYTQTTTNTQDWTGGFTIAGIITDQWILDQLNDFNTLEFSFLVGGDLYLTGGQLSLDVTEIAPPPGNSVPEPSTTLLMLAALGGLAFSKRRRNSLQ